MQKRQEKARKGLFLPFLHMIEIYCRKGRGGRHRYHESDHSICDVLDGGRDAAHAWLSLPGNGDSFFPRVTGSQLSAPDLQR